MGDLSSHEIEQLQGTRLSNKAPWETWDEEMGDSKLSPILKEQIARYEERVQHKSSQEAEEALARERELSNAVAAQYRWVTKEEYGDIEPRIGRIMHSSVLLHKLKTECHLNAWYAEHILPGRLKLIVKQAGKEPEFAVWVQEGFTSEFTIMKFDEHDVPLDERYRGYRTVLLQLIMKSLISEEDVLKAFGSAIGPASVRYNSTLYEWRNRRVKII